MEKEATYKELDYDPFGSAMSSRSFTGASGYKFGYNTQLRSDELHQNHYTAQFWEYDSRVVKRWNTDPVTYPWQSPYTINNNNSIVFTDPLGLFGTRKEARQYKKENRLKGRVQKDKSGESFSINNYKDKTSTFNDSEFGIMTGALVFRTKTIKQNLANNTTASDNTNVVMPDTRFPAKSFPSWWDKLIRGRDIEQSGGIGMFGNGSGTFDGSVKAKKDKKTGLSQKDNYILNLNEFYFPKAGKYTFDGFSPMTPASGIKNAGSIYKNVKENQQQAMNKDKEIVMWQIGQKWDQRLELVVHEDMMMVK